MCFKASRITFTEKAVEGTNPFLYVVSNSDSAVNSVSLSSQSTHIMSENFVELDGISRMSRG